MKRKTCKILVTLGILLIILSLIVGALFLYFKIMPSVLSPDAELPSNVKIKSWLLFIIWVIVFPFLTPFGLIGLALIIVGISKWDSSYKPKKPRWSALPAWLEGAIIGIMVGLILFIIRQANNHYCNYRNVINLTCRILQPIRLLEKIIYPIMLLSSRIYEIFGTKAYIISVSLTFILEFAVIGTLIALIIQKIEKK